MTVTIVLTVMLIAALHIIWSPKILDRYQSDYVWLLSIGAFCGAGACFAGAEDGRKLSGTIALASFACVILTAFAMCTLIQGRVLLAGYIYFSDLESSNPVAIAAMNLAIAAVAAYLLALILSIVNGFSKHAKD